MRPSFSMTFLGVGAGLSPDLGNNNVLVQDAEGATRLLIDCGPITVHDLNQRDRLRSINHVLITHVHDDHVGGLQFWAQMCRYIYGIRPHLHLLEDLREELWEHSLRGGLGRVHDPQNEPEDVGLDAYFHLSLLREDAPLEIPHLPVIRFQRTLHVKNKPSFGFFLGEEIYYSSDTQELPPRTGPTGKPLRVIFQDCQLFDTRHAVHTSLSRLQSEMPPEQRAITYLMHYNHTPTGIDARALGFRGFVTRDEPIWLEA